VIRPITLFGSSKPTPTLPALSGAALPAPLLERRMGWLVCGRWPCALEEKLLKLPEEGLCRAERYCPLVAYCPPPPPPRPF